MSVLEYRIKKDDTLPKLRHQLKLNGAVIDITNATVTLVRERRIDGVSVPVTGTVTKIDNANGIVEYSPSDADTAAVDVFNLAWRLVWLDGDLTIPTDCPIRMLVL